MPFRIRFQVNKEVCEAAPEWQSSPFGKGWESEFIWLNLPGQSGLNLVEGHGAPPLEFPAEAVDCGRNRPPIRAHR